MSSAVVDCKVCRHQALVALQVLHSKRLMREQLEALLATVSLAAPRHFGLQPVDESRRSPLSAGFQGVYTPHNDSRDDVRLRYVKHRRYDGQRASSS
jgi:hypothetical protein